MDELFQIFDKNDYIGCIGNYNPQDRLCTRKCAMAMKCIIEYNRKVALSQLADIFGEEDLSMANNH